MTSIRLPRILDLQMPSIGSPDYSQRRRIIQGTYEVWFKALKVGDKVALDTCQGDPVQSVLEGEIVGFTATGRLKVSFQSNRNETLIAYFLPSARCYANSYEILDPKVAKAYIDNILQQRKARAKADREELIALVKTLSPQDVTLYLRKIKADSKTNR